MITAKQARTISNAVNEPFLKDIEERIRKKANKGETNLETSYLWDSSEGIKIRTLLPELGYEVVKDICKNNLTLYSDTYVEIKW